MSKVKPRIGIDLGGTKIEAVVLKGRREIFRKRIPTEQEKGYRHILDNINRLYKEAVRVCKGGRHTLGIGIPGSVSTKTGLVRNANTVCFIGKPLKKDLERTLGHPIAVENDANCFAMAEALLGAGKGKAVVFGVIMGTGCGAGIVWNGKVHGGLQGIAGEWGHMQIDPAGPLCYCGKTGCVETYISGGGVQKLYASASGRKRTMPEILALYRKGDKTAARVMKIFFGKFGVALSNVLDVLDPDIVVLGGGMSNIRELYTIGLSEVRKNIFSDGFETPIVRNRLGDSAGVLGAAMIGI
jgi:fructokinase